MDQWIVLSVFVSYGFFVAAHLLTFRFFKPEEVLKSLMRVVTASFLFHGAAFFLFYGNISVPVVVVLLLSSLILGFLIFVHILCIFGPYETSLRLRLVRELYQGPPNGMSKEDILKKYNARMILETRLSRLTASGELIQHGETYVINKHVNVFFFIDVVVGVLQKIIDPDGSFLSTKDKSCSRD